MAAAIPLKTIKQIGGSGGNKERVVAATRGSVDQTTPLWEIAPRHEHSRANQNPQIVTK